MSVVPQNGERGRDREKPRRGRRADPDCGGGAKQPTHILRNPSVNRPREKRRRGGALERAVKKRRKRGALERASTPVKQLAYEHTSIKQRVRAQFLNRFGLTKNTCLRHSVSRVQHGHVKTHRRASLEPLLALLRGGVPLQVKVHCVARVAKERRCHRMRPRIGPHCRV